MFREPAQKEKKSCQEFPSLSRGEGCGRGAGDRAPRTFHQLVDERAQVVGLFLLPFTHLNDIGKILTNILQ